MANQTDVVDRLRLEIETLLRQYPQLADDDVLRADMIDGATDTKEILTVLSNHLADAKALESGLREYIKDLAARENRFGERQEFLRGLMFKVLESAAQKKYELPAVTLSLRNNPPRLLGDADAATMPDDLCHIKRTVNRTKVREALEAGREVLGFTLSNAAPSLSVRVK